MSTPEVTRGATRSSLAAAHRSFAVQLDRRRVALEETEKVATRLHEEILAAHDRGASVEEIASDLQVTEEVADHWIGCLVRGRIKHGGLVAPAFNADRWLNGTSTPEGRSDV